MPSIVDPESKKNKKKLSHPVQTCFGKLLFDPTHLLMRNDSQFRRFLHAHLPQQLVQCAYYIATRRELLSAILLRRQTGREHLRMQPTGITSVNFNWTNGFRRRTWCACAFQICVAAVRSLGRASQPMTPSYHPVQPPPVESGDVTSSTMRRTCCKERTASVWKDWGTGN
jgi:hypothetical protein